MGNRFSFIFLGVLSLTSLQTSAETIKVAGVDFAPIVFHDGKKIEGIGVDIIRELAKRTDLKLDEFQIQTERMNKLNTELPALYPVTIRTPDREEMKFQWIGKILDDHYCFVTLKTAKLVSTAEEAAKLKTVGSTRGGSTEKKVNSLGLKNIDIALGNSGNVRKLMAGKIEAWFTGGTVAMYSIRKEGFDPKLVQCGGDFGVTSYWIAATSLVPEVTFKKLQEAFTALEKDKFVSQAIKKFLPDSAL